MIKLRNRKQKEIGIMISPMIDMSFLLLVFFIVSTMYMSETKTLPVQLPKASAGKSRWQPVSGRQAHFGERAHQPGEAGFCQ